MELILFIVIVSLLYPSSSGGHAVDLVMIPVAICGIALLIAAWAATFYAAVGVMELTGRHGDLGTFLFAWFGIIVALAVVGKFGADLIDRHRAMAAN